MIFILFFTLFVCLYFVLGFFLFRSINKDGLDFVKFMFLIAFVLSTGWLFASIVIMFGS